MEARRRLALTMIYDEPSWRVASQIREIGLNIAWGRVLQFNSESHASRTDAGV
jgi:hypothetical protein